MGAIVLRKRDWLAFLGFGLFTIAISPAVFAIAGLVIVGGLIVGSTQAGLNSLQNIIDAKSEIKGIASKAGIGNCDTAAKGMEKTLKRRNLKYGVIILKANDPKKNNLIYSESKHVQVGTAGWHIGIIFDNKVYCNIHPGGLSEKAWKADFYIDGPYTFYTYTNISVAAAMKNLGIK